MTPTEKLVSARTIAKILLEELPPRRAAALMVRIHAHLPETREDLTFVLNEIHSELMLFTKKYEYPIS